MFKQLHARRIARNLDSRWWILALRALFGSLLAFAALVNHGGTLVTLLLLCGLYAIVEGAVAVVVGTMTGWSALLLTGASGIAAGAVTVLRPSITPVALTAVAIWSLLRGGLDVHAAMMVARNHGNEWLLAATGFVSILFATALLVMPSISMSTAAGVVAIFGIAQSALCHLLAVRLYRIERRATASASIATAQRRKGTKGCTWRH